MGKNSLHNIQIRFLAETQMILDIFAQSMILSHSQSNFCREMCAIRLYDAWARFCRELILISAVEKPITISGRILPAAPSIRKRKDVIIKLCGIHKKQFGYWEPNWKNPTECIKAANDLLLANRVDIGNGIGLSPSPIENLRRIRNFCAHRKEETANYLNAICRNLGINGKYSAREIIAHIIPPGHSVFEDWVYQIRTMVHIAMQ